MCRELCLSVWNNCFRLAVAEKKKFCHPSPIYKKGLKKPPKPNPETKKNKAGRKIDFLKLRRFCVCFARFAQLPSEAFKIVPTVGQLTLKLFLKPWVQAPANSENCTLLCETSEMEQGSGATPFFKIYLLKCRLWWMFLLGGCCLAYPASVETCLACENKWRMDIDQS